MSENLLIPAEIQQEAQEATSCLLLAKSKSVYEKELVEFNNWGKKGVSQKEQLQKRFYYPIF